MSTEVQATTNTESAPKLKSSKRKASKSAAPAKQAKSGSKKPAKANAGKKPQKAATKAESKSGTKERTGTKKAIVLELLRRKEGATTAEIAEATDWQNHTIRGFISGTLTKKMGLSVDSSKNDAGERPTGSPE